MMTNLKVITDLSQIPAFADETEEADFWSTHKLATGMMTREKAEANDLLPPTRARKSTPTSIRLETDLERRIKILADMIGTPYQTLLKQFVLERVYEEEKRRHIL